MVLYSAPPMLSYMCAGDHACSQQRSVPQPEVRAHPVSRSPDSSSFSFSTGVFLSPHISFFNPKQRKRLWPHFHFQLLPCFLFPFQQNLVAVPTVPNFSLPCLVCTQSSQASHLTTSHLLVRVARDLHVGFCDQFSGLTMSVLSL